MDARYQSGARGNFISEDPSFLDIGSPSLAGDVQQGSLLANPNYVGLSNSMQLPQDQNAKDVTLTLSDPQSLNSYSYVKNIPIKNIDPNGKGAFEALVAGAGAFSFSYLNNYRSDVTGNLQSDVVIPIKDITLVQVENSPQRGRVLRRIAIYAKNPDGSPKWVDVSLKHFVPSDIRKLMNLLHQERPDLSLPKGWIAG